MELASRVPGGLRVAGFVAGTVIFDDMLSATENPTGTDVASAYVAVCGFPRTGTTFIQGAVNRALEDERACWKNHDPLSIPLYAAAGVPTLITLRSPADAIVSWSLYNHDQPSASLMAKRAAMYTAWHNEALRATCSPWVTVIDFDAFCADPIGLLDDVLGRPHTTTVTPSAVAQYVRASNAASQTAVRHGNVPDARRAELRTPFVDLLDERPVRRALARAEEIHGRMQRLI